VQGYSKREIAHFIYIAHDKNSSKLKDNQQINDVIQVCFILEGYHQRGPTHPNEDTDRSYPEGFHQKEPTHSTEEDADRPYTEGFHQKGPTHPTEEDTDRPYSEGFHQMRRPPNHLCDGKL
jgi:hypothetical protein